MSQGLTELAGLSSSRLSLEELLTQVALLAVKAVPGADGAGLTLVETDRANILVDSAPFVRQITEIQHTLKEGPCISGIVTGRIARSGFLGADSRWPRLGGRAGRLGVHSSLTLPLLVLDNVIGVIAAYAQERNAFDDHAENLGQLFAAPAAIVVENAHALARSQRLNEYLQRSLATRAVIDQAIGILISRSGITAEEAFDRLRMQSQINHVKLVVVATNIVETAARRARQRPPTPSFLSPGS
jgi:GAF domain-containing protein